MPSRLVQYAHRRFGCIRHAMRWSLPLGMPANRSARACAYPAFLAFIFWLRDRLILIDLPLEVVYVFRFLPVLRDADFLDLRIIGQVLTPLVNTRE